MQGTDLLDSSRCNPLVTGERHRNMTTHHIINDHALPLGCSDVLVYSLKPTQSRRRCGKQSILLFERPPATWSY